MTIRLYSTLLAALLTGCATHRTYSDATNAHERKTYIACAVTRAFLHADLASSPHDAARTAMRRCEAERQAVMFKLMEENADKPFGRQFVASYMQELEATMRDHIALRLTQSRAREQVGKRT